MKSCTTCGQSKKDSEFALSNKTKSGLAARCRACESKRGSLRYQKIKEKAVNQARTYRQLNHEKRLEIERASRLKNKESQRPAKNARQQVRNKKLADKNYAIINKDLKRLYSYPCYSCGSLENQSIDHKIPLSRGGSHKIGNLMTLCKSCNSSKHARTIMEWRISKIKKGDG